SLGLFRRGDRETAFRVRLRRARRTPRRRTVTRIVTRGEGCARRASGRRASPGACARTREWSQRGSRGGLPWRRSRVCARGGGRRRCGGRRREGEQALPESSSPPEGNRL